ncbi:MAG: hypothetical protein WCW62_18590, partial [Bacteroidales bacterium]
MKKFLLSGFIICLALVIHSCESGIDLIYESSGRPVVYCLLNPRDSVQYLRISRSFILRGNPEGQVIPADSLVLDADFYAYLEQERPDGTREINYFELADISRRDSGMFPQEGLVVLKSHCKVEGGKEYGLYIHFPNIPKLVAGTATVVNPVEILDPNPLPGREVTILEDQGYLMRWTKSIKFAVYQPTIRFIFLEGDRNSQMLHEVDIPKALIYGDTDAGILTTYLNGAGFIDDLIANLAPPDSGMRRKIIGFDLLMAAGGAELAVFTRSGQNSVTSFTGLDEFSNMDGAVGIYSSSTFTGAYNNRFTDITINYLADSEKTR